MLSSRLARVGASIATLAFVGAAGLVINGTPVSAAPPAGGYSGATTTPAAWPVSFTVSGGNVVNYASTVTIGCAPFFFDLYFESIPINTDGSFAATVSPGSGFIMEVSGNISDGGSASGVQDLDSDIGCGSADTPWAATLTDPAPTTTTTTTTIPPTTTTTVPPTTSTTTTMVPPTTSTTTSSTVAPTSSTTTTGPPPSSTTSTTVPPTSSAPSTTVPPASTTTSTTSTTTSVPPASSSTVPGSTVTTAPPSVPPTTPAPAGPTATISATAVPRGGVVTVHGTGFEPGESVTATQFSTPFDIGTNSADAGGAVTFTWTIRPDESVGEHRVVLTGAETGTTSVTFRVTEDAELPATGAATGRLVAVGATSLAAGLVALVLAGRRRDAAS